MDPDALPSNEVLRPRLRVRLALWGALGVVIAATLLAGTWALLIRPSHGPARSDPMTGSASSAGSGGTLGARSRGEGGASTSGGAGDAGSGAAGRSDALVGEAVPAFSLTDGTGRNVTLASLQGRVWVANFIFTRCTTVCPTLTREMAQVRERLAASGAGEILSVSFSVDPLYDTPPVLSAYGGTVRADPATWLFLTGDPKEVLRVIRGGFHLMMSEPGEGAPVHSNRFVVVDGEGRIRASHLGNEKGAVEAIVKESISVLRDGIRWNTSPSGTGDR